MPTTETNNNETYADTIADVWLFDNRTQHTCGRTPFGASINHTHRHLLLLWFAVVRKIVAKYFRIVQTQSVINAKYFNSLYAFVKT